MKQYKKQYKPNLWNVGQLRTAADAIAYIERLDTNWPTDPGDVVDMWRQLHAISFDFPVAFVDRATPGLKHLHFYTLVDVLVKHPVLRTQASVAMLLTVLQDRDLHLGRNADEFKVLVERLPSIWAEHRETLLAALSLRDARESLRNLLESSALTADDRTAILRRAIEQVDVRRPSSLQLLHGEIKRHGTAAEAAALVDRVKAQALADVEAEKQRSVVDDYIAGGATWNDVTTFVNDPDGYRQWRNQEAKDQRTKSSSGW